VVIGIEAQRIFRQQKHGMDFVVLEIIRELQQIDSENQYVIFTNVGEDICLQETENFKVVSFEGSYPVWEQIKLPKMCKKHKVQMLHCTSNTAPINPGVPLVITLHDIIYFENNPFFTRGYNSYQRFGNMYRRMDVSRILKKAAKIITVSAFEKERISKQLGLDSQKVKVVYNGVGKHFIDPAYREDEVREKYKLPQNFFLFLGNTDPKKNTENTVLAFAHYVEQYDSNACLVVADLPPVKVEEYLRGRGMKSKMSNFHFTGYIQNKDLPTVLHLANVFLYPSKRESFGLPLLEAMASKTPVITSNTSSMPEVAGGAAHLVNPGKPGEIAEALHIIETNEAHKEELIAKGIKRVKDFNWKVAAESVLQIYKEASGA